MAQTLGTLGTVQGLQPPQDPFLRDVATREARNIANDLDRDEADPIMGRFYPVGGMGGYRRRGGLRPWQPWRQPPQVIVQQVPVPWDDEPDEADVILAGSQLDTKIAAFCPTGRCPGAR
jgi:hypothetical protein